MNSKNLLLVGVHLGISLAVFSLMDSAQPQPYMDEVFHVPQAQDYCKGRFHEWNDKITTLPGLYLLSIGIVNPVTKWTGVLYCDTSHLRLINVVLSSTTLLVLQRLLSQIHGAKHFYEEYKGMWSAFNLSIFPVLYFYSFLYYTDVASTFMVLLMYCLHLDRREWFASFIGLLAVLLRQTNIIWVGFVAVQSMGPYVLHAILSTQVEQSDMHRPAKFSLTTLGQTREVIEGLYRLTFVEPRKGLKMLLVATRVAGGYVLVMAAFVMFVLFNGGVVVGDRKAHVATFHPTQLLYFLGFTLGFGSTHLVDKTRILHLLSFVRKHKVSTGLLVLLAAFLIDSYTLAHPYLLADNRHYTFYVWRRIVVRYGWSRFALLPFYVYAAFSISYSVRKSDIVFKLSFPLFAALSVTPQLLLEFRYFVIPYLMYRMHVRPQSSSRLALETGLYFVVNLLTIGLFVLKPFEWAHEPGQVQRFVW